MLSNINNAAIRPVAAGGHIAENAPEILRLNAAGNRLERKLAEGALRVVRRGVDKPSERQSSTRRWLLSVESRSVGSA